MLPTIRHRLRERGALRAIRRNANCLGFLGRTRAAGPLMAVIASAFALRMAFAAAPASPQGVITAREFLDIPSTTIADLRNSPKFPDSPDAVEYASYFEWPAGDEFGGPPPSDVKDNYGVQLIGYLYPPITGDYRFFIAADDNAELWLSSDDNPANKVLIAREPEWNPVRSWTSETRRPLVDPGTPDERRANVSKGISLLAGRAYYIEALMKEAGGGDNLAVAWHTPAGETPVDGESPIPGTYLSTIDRQSGPVTVTQQPQSLTVTEGSPATFTVSVDGTPPYTFQWLKDGAPIPGATDSVYHIDQVSLLDSGAYSVVVAGAIGDAVSNEAILSVQLDATPPTLISGSGSAAFNELTVRFSEPLDPASAWSAGNYALSGGVMVLSASGSEDPTQQEVILRTSPQPQGAILTLTVNNVKDAAGNLIAANSALAIPTFVWVPGAIAHEYWQDLSPGGIEALLADPRYPKRPSWTSVEKAWEYPPFAGEEAGSNYGNKLSGWFVPPVSGDYIFFTNSDDPSNLYLSVDEDPASKKLIAQETGWSGVRQWQTAGGGGNPETKRSDQFLESEWPDFVGDSAIHLQEGQRYYMESIHTEGGGGDHVAATYILEGEPAPANGSAPRIAGDVVGVYMDPGDPSFPLSKVLPVSARRSFGSLNQRGFQGRIHQTSAAGISASNLRAERQLAGEFGPSNFAVDFVEDTVVNYSNDGASPGRFSGDTNFPNISQGVDSVAMELIAFLELRAGEYRMGVTSDDGFAVSAWDPNGGTNVIVLGQFDGARSVADTTFQFVAPEPGLYPFRLIWTEATGEANLEWWHAEPTNSPNEPRLVLINDPNDPGAISAFLPQPANEPPSISSISDVTVVQGDSIGAIAFTVSDMETSPENLSVSAISSNQSLVPNGNLLVAGSGASRTLGLFPASNQTGATVITVTVADEGGLEAIETFLLTIVPAKPEIIDPPDDVAAGIGDNIVLSVEALGVPPLSYQWRRNGMVLPGATDNVYRINGAQPTDGGSYSVVVISPTGLTESPLVRVEVMGESFSDVSDDFPAVGLAAIEEPSGRLVASNRGATNQLGEPLHAEKPGGKSVWFVWRASRDGIATFDTLGSNFDTLLGVYLGNTMPNLMSVASVPGDEDGSEYFGSRVVFNAQAGLDYWVAIDGYFGDSGELVVQWNLEPTNETVPVILEAPQPSSVRPGNRASFSVKAEDPGKRLTYQWFQNGQPLEDVTNVTEGSQSTNLVIHAARVKDLGFYFVRVSNRERHTDSVPEPLELSTQPGSVTRDKFEDLYVQASGAELFSRRRAGLHSFSVAAGALARHMFLNAGSAQSAETFECANFVLDETRWYTLDIEAAGTLVVDTRGSGGNTVMALFEGCERSLLEIECLTANDDAESFPWSFIAETVTPGCYHIQVDNVGASATPTATVMTWVLLPHDRGSNSVRGLSLIEDFADPARRELRLTRDENQAQPDWRVYSSTPTSSSPLTASESVRWIEFFDSAYSPLVSPQFFWIQPDF